ncbi:hypothetical protein [Nocardioides sp. YIM 152315]|uniref:hypothetical protein n=1 Tax=Nocardioides sp. YIM 152315 TaxID=3031760 RepID=UPI0023DC8D14|nr:hypothetical protein [Nocardioides sp. YIM 152315]MDF1602965.1 hypothetical protein [Nocardioides sp. YIM 152315]
MAEPQTSLRREVATLAPPVLLLLAMLEVAARHGAGHRGLALAGLVVLVTQVLPGALVWRSVRPVRGWLVEDLAMGLATGAAMAVPCQVVAVALGQRWLSAALPVAVAVALIAVPLTRRRIGSRACDPLPWAWGASVAATSVGPMLAVLAVYASPLRWRGWLAPYVDAPFHQSLVGELMHHFPPHYPQAGLETVRYHWFSHAWSAQIATVSGAEIDTVLWRFAPALLMIAAPVALATAAMRLTGRSWSAPLAAALAYLLPDVTPWGTAALTTPLHTPYSPSQQLAALLVVSVIALLTLRWRGEAPPWSLLPLGLMLVVAGGTKGSTLPVVLAGALLAVAALLALRDRERLRVVAVDTLVIGAVLLVLVRFVTGSGEGLTLDYGRAFAQAAGVQIAGHDVDPASAVGVVAAALVLLTRLLAALAGLSLLVLRTTRRDPMTWLLVGSSAAGAGALVLLSVPGSGQLYFFLAAKSSLALAGAWGTTELLQRAGTIRPLVVAGLGVGILALPAAQLTVGRDVPGVGRAVLALTLLLVLIALGALVAARATRTRARGAIAVAAVSLSVAAAVPAVQAVVDWEQPAAAVHPTPTSMAISFGDVRALRWLRDHSDPDDVVATNNHCLTPVADPCDRRRFFVGAYAERRSLVEGWTYNWRAAELYTEYGSALYADAQFWDQDLLALNDGFIAKPDAEQARRLWGLGVRWVVVWADAPHADDLAPFATEAHRGRTVTIYRMTGPR